MADLATVTNELGALPADLRAIFLRIFTAILTDLRFGHSTGATRDPLKNFSAGFYRATTPPVAGTEFTIPHGFGTGTSPYLAMPVLLLDTVGSTDGVFTVNRAADDKRLYLTSTAENQAVAFIVEG